ncbi:MAG: methyltransferase domain-containing protein [Desulfobulbaceae bacterium]|nr:methyltransferase domain-containing protein [Desulfobulbaceae bacterium]
MVKITEQEIQVFSKYVSEISGIYLDKRKGYLLEARLQLLLKEHFCGTFGELLYKTRSDPSGGLKKKIIDAISTNETFFFRDNTPFNLLKNKIIPDLIDRRRQQYQSSRIPIRIWSAACSTGQEVYSIAITLCEMLPIRNFDITILGTDISDKAIAQASYGKYNVFEVKRGMPSPILNKYFTPAGDGWRIKDEIRVMAQYRKINLMEQFTGLGPFDIVFCRNVAIYFTADKKIQLFRKIARVLAPDGALIVGGSESLGSVAPDFTAQHYLRGIFYQLKGHAETAAVTAPLPPRARIARPKPSSQAARSPRAKPERPHVPEREAVKKMQAPQTVPMPAAPQKETFTPQERIPSASQVSLQEKLAEKQGKGKSSLLSSLRRTREADKSVVAGKDKTGDTERGSLLDKIRSKK